MLSFWEHRSLSERYDVLVIGAGITGCSAAISLKTESPKMRVALIDKEGLFMSTASSKNAGFACFGSMSELLEDKKSLGEEAMLALVSKRWDGLQYLRSLIPDKAMDYVTCGGLEVFEDEHLLELCRQERLGLNASLRAIIGNEVFKEVNSLNTIVFQGFKGMIASPYEGQLDPARMMAAFHQRLRALDVPVFIGTAVDRLDDANEEVLVHVGEATLRARDVLVTTNGLAAQLIDVPVRPTRAQVLITSPIPELNWQHVVHLDHGYTYFRNVGNRVLLGGRRNYDEATEYSSEMALNPVIQEHLEQLLREKILPGKDVSIERRWVGIMGTGPDREPIMASPGQHIHCAVRLGGMGVAIGSLLGRDAARRLIGRE
ncbi:MAG: FAD-dependent oxidoreductase [Bacteroidetes bacterium]|nr:FAD-dependent oxidoreductase [Bacteroidota bacterium]